MATPDTPYREGVRVQTVTTHGNPTGTTARIVNAGAHTELGANYVLVTHNTATDSQVKRVKTRHLTVVDDNTQSQSGGVYT